MKKQFMLDQATVWLIVSVILFTAIVVILFLNKSNRHVNNRIGASGLAFFSSKSRKYNQTEKRNGEGDDSEGVGKSPHERISPFSLWSYSGVNGPQSWSQLHPNFNLCELGGEQSPIDIKTPALVKSTFMPQRKPFKLELRDQVSAAIIHNSRFLELEITRGYSLSFQNRSYRLTSAHVHSPSEHLIDGLGYHAEIQFFFESESSEKALALALLIEEADKTVNQLLTSMVEHLPEGEGRLGRSFPVDLSAIVRKFDSFYHYSGSKTYPDCSEDVDWVIAKDPSGISSRDMDAFDQILRRAARPVQPLGARQVGLFQAY